MCSFYLIASICASLSVSFPDLITLLKLSLKQSDVRYCISTFIASLVGLSILLVLHLILDRLNHIYILQFIESLIDCIPHSKAACQSFSRMLENKCKFTCIQLTKNHIFLLRIMNKSSISLDMSKNSTVELASIQLF